VSRRAAPGPWTGPSSFSLYLGGATAPGCVVVEHCHLEWTGEETPKAIRVTGKTYTGKTVAAWLPKRAIVSERVDKLGCAVADDQPAFATTYSLARWFRPTGWTARFLELTADVAGVSA